MQRPDPELDTAQQEAGLILDGWVQRYHLCKRGEISTPDNDFKLCYMDIERQVSLLVSAGSILIKQGSSPWQVALEAL
ncbi:hypothetical protein D3C84_963840 [compost metagenome]